MKRLFTLFAIALAFVASSCNKFDDSEIWDKLNEHDKRITALEELCKQMNTNIVALQTVVNALQKNDYITNVSPVRKDGEVVGYTITFAHNDTITIYHGTNGKDGANGKDGKDGKDGYTPQIGVMKDTDGIYYWTVDGEWLLDGKGNKIKAVGEDGRDGQDGTNGNDGQDGNNGQDGVDGKDGITPRLKIENDYWYVSYDNGATWTELGKATGEDGTDGDTIFSSVTQDDEYVYFNLADGTMITLPKHDKENIQFEDLQVKAICCKNWDTNNDGELSYAEAAAVTDIGTIFKGNTNIIAFTELKYFTGIAEIPTGAFSGCTALWKINLPKNIIFIGQSAFRKCNSINGIEIPEGLMSIGDYAFKDCNSLSILDMPKTVIEIGTQSFYGCDGLQSTTIPNSVTMIGAEAFYGCTGSLYIDCNLVDQKLNYNTSLYYSEFSEIIIGNSVTSIGEYYFTHCGSATNITIPDSVTSIASHAFYYCSKLSEVTIPKNVKHLGGWAFEGCSSLTNVYCKPEIPTETDFSSSAEEYIFPFNKNLKIYIPRNSYYLYVNYKPQYNDCFSWAEYKNYYVPYDFE